jgi:hypothetical protein
MNKALLTFFILFFSVAFAFGYKLSGKLTDEKGNAIAYARIIVLETSYGATTDEGGMFTLRMPSGNYRIQFQHIAFQTKTLSIELTKDQILEVRLSGRDVEMETVEIEGGKKDPAYGIMKEVIANKKTHLKQFDSYSCDTYMKISLERDTLHEVQRNDQVSITISFGKKKKKGQDSRAVDSLIADSVMIDSALVDTILADTVVVDTLASEEIPLDSLATDSLGQDSIPVGKKKIVLVESVSSTYFDAPNRYKTIVRAYRNVAARGEEGAGRGGMGYGWGNEDMPIYRTQSTNPYIFYQDVSDADFNFYQNLIDAPKLGDRPFVSPLNSTLWQLTYKYHLDSAYLENGKVHYLISFWPRNVDAPVFKGKMIILDKVFAIKYIEFEVLPGSTPYFKKFEMKHAYKETPDRRWILEEEHYVYEIKDGPNTYFGDNYARHTDYELDIELPNNFFKNELRRTDKEAFEQGEAYWASVRPMELEQSEIKFEQEQDSIRAYYTSDEYLKEQDSIFNKLNIWNFIATGIQFRNRKHRLRFYFSPLLEQPNFVGVGGYRHSLRTTVVKTWPNFKALSVTAYGDYGVVNKDLKGTMRIGFTYNPRRFARAYVRFGDQYRLINNNETITAILTRGNFLNKVYFGLGHRIEIANGLMFDANIDFADRKPIDNLALAEWTEELFGSNNTPRSFDLYREFLIDLKLIWTPGQKYIMEPYRKVNLGSKWPTFTLHYKKSLPGIMGSDLNFDYLSLRAKHEIRIGTFGTTKWSVFTGKFLQANSLRFTDFTFFRGSDPYLFANPLSNFQSLGPTISTENAFFSGHYIHNFEGAILNKVPLIKKTKSQLMGGGSVLLVEDGNFFHSELFAGVGVPFRIRMQRFKASAFVVTSYSNLDKAIGTQFKIGLTFYDPIKRQWGY